jgi:glycosyltransferase involved in cell wall biosynthesis
MRIAMFTNNYYPFIGGVPISIDRLTRGLRGLGHHVTIFAPEYPDQPPDADPGIVRCKLMRYHKSKEFNFAIANIFSRELDAEFLRRDFDVIHLHHPFWMGVKGMNYGKKYGIPVVFTYHTRFDHYSHYVPLMKTFFKHYISHSIVKRFSSKSAAVFAPTRTARNYLVELGVKKPIEVLPTGIELLREQPEGGASRLRSKFAPNGEFLLCTVSRLAPEKNIFFLLRGIRYIKEHSSVPFRCVIAGEGPERESMEAYIREAGLEDTVTLLGKVPPDKVAEIYYASDLFVFASVTETQGMVLLEAMAGHCPVVAVLSGGVDDVVVDGYNGYRTHENAAEWSRRVMALMENPDKVREMSQNAFVSARRYSIEAMAAQAAQIYRQVCDV